MSLARPKREGRDIGSQATPFFERLWASEATPFFERLCPAIKAAKS
jgi:hypothetical protein